MIGGDAAGMSAASQARRMRGPDELEIVAFERGHFSSYSASASRTGWAATSPSGTG